MCKPNMLIQNETPCPCPDPSNKILNNFTTGCIH